MSASSGGRGPPRQQRDSAVVTDEHGVQLFTVSTTNKQAKKRKKTDEPQTKDHKTTNDQRKTDSNVTTTRRTKLTTLDPWTELRSWPSERANRSVMVEDADPDLLTALEPTHRADTLTLGPRTRVFTFSSRRKLEKSTKPDPRQFGKAARYSTPPTATLPGPWTLPTDAPAPSRLPKPDRPSEGPPAQTSRPETPPIYHIQDSYFESSSEYASSEDSNESEGEVDNGFLKVKSRRKRTPPTTSAGSTPAAVKVTTTPKPAPRNSQTPTPLPDQNNTAASEQRMTRTTVKITRHTTDNNNPFFIMKLIRQHNLNIETPRQYWAYSTGTTTLTFNTMDEAEQFVQAIPEKTFGPSAKLLIISRPTTQGQRLPRNREISVVMKNVGTQIPEDELLQILGEKYPGIKRISRITSAQTNQPTQMVRLIVQDVTTADQLLRGINVAGRNYKVEPAHETVFHRPCQNCAQYGHDKTDCKSDKICFTCGNNPDHCNHLPDSKVKFCASCKSDTHYTGQARCPNYPRHTATQQTPTHIPVQIPQQLPPPIPKPSQSSPTPTNEPRPGLSYARAVKPTKNKETEKTTEPTQTVDQIVASALKSAMQKLESYVDEQLNRVRDEIVMFTISLLTTDAKPKTRRTTLATANQTARRLLRRQVAHHFVDNKLRISLAPLTQDTTNHRRSTNSGP